MTGQRSSAIMSSIQVENLTKHYKVHFKEPGLIGSLKSFYNRQTTLIKAVDGISFQIAAGEMVGFLGANGAGKTTTLKLLSGLLHPTSGKISVGGHTPHQRKEAYLSQMTLVMGNKNQLVWDLPASESFLINKAIYRISNDEYTQTLAEFSNLLNLAPLLNKQVRKLSLGERMKCELAAALLHKPKILFLDEPTLGLDVTMQVTIREFITEYNRRHNATVMLTSHYMADVTALTRRIIVVDKGKLLYDGDLQTLVEQMAPYKKLSLTLREPKTAEQLSPFGQVASINGIQASLQVPRGEATTVAASILNAMKVDDLLIEDPPVEDVIREIFSGKIREESQEKIERGV